MTTVLLVEDNPAHARLASLLLQHAGYATLHAASGEAGLALARERPPALVLADLELPGMNGLELLVRLKADPATRALPVVVMSSYLASGAQAAAYAAGVAGFVAKPYHYVDFMKVVKDVLAAE